MYRTTGSARRAFLLASVALAAITAAEPASAGKDMRASPPNLWSWSGVYIGAHGGYGWARDPFTDDIFSGKALPLSGINGHGFVGGFQAGVNWQSGVWVGGLEIDLSATGIKGATSTTSGALTFGPTTLTESDTRTDKFDTLGSARVRLGYLPLPHVLLYGTAGPAWTRLVTTDDGSFTISQAGVGSETESATTATPTWRVGAVAGVGAEVRLGDSNWLGRVEYLHYDFGKSNTFTASFATETVTSGNLTLDVVRAGLSYKLGQGMGFGGGSAMAAAMPLKAPRLLPAVWTWSGFYIGGHAGFGWGNDPMDNPGQGDVGTITLTGIRSSGFVGGVHAGGNWQAGNAWVGGLELDLSGSGIKGSNTYQAPLTGGATGTDTLTQTDRFELLGSARARLGYLFWPDWLFYGTGGLAWTRMTQTLDEVENVTSGGTSFSRSTGTVNWEFGWVAGFGVETRLWNSNWLARLEYLHYDFGDQGSSFDVGFSQSTGHLTTDVVRGGLSYKFDWADPAASAGKVAMPVKAHPIVATDWSGFYLGAHAGYGWGRDPMSQSDFSTIGLFGLDDFQRADVNSNGFVAGFQAGANRQMGAFVGGVEIDISGTGIKGTTTVSDLDNDETLTVTDKFDTLGSARGRIGYLALPNVLLYGTGGLGWARLNQTTVDTPLGGGPSGSTTPFWTFGWVAGAGGETRLWNSNWFLRAEYLHYDFGNSGSTNTTITVNAPGFAVGSAATAFSTGHLTTDVVRTGLSYKLN